MKENEINNTNTIKHKSFYTKVVEISNEQAIPEEKLYFIKNGIEEIPISKTDFDLLLKRNNENSSAKNVIFRLIHNSRLYIFSLLINSKLIC